MSKEFEVEKKFSLDGVDLERLTQGADLLSEKTFTDTYFDNQEHLLTKNDKWLRSRDGKFELKLPLNQGEGALSRKLDRYEEVTDEDKIKEALGINSPENLDSCLEELGYKPFCSITSNRSKYKRGDFGIDIDKMDFGYTVGEIELMVKSEADMKQALEMILNFAKENGISIKPVLGKVAEYLRRKSTGHYQELVEAGVY